MPIWKTLSRSIAFEAAPYLRVVREQIEIAPGKVIDDFFQVELRTFVLVVPVLPDGQVMTVRAYRHGPRRECLSLPGGFLDGNESPDEAARRELAEEAGLVPGRLIGLGSYVDNGNQRGCIGHYFLALDCTPSGPVAPDTMEAVTAALMQPAEIDAALDAGQFGVIHHVAGWCLARRHPAFPR